MIRDLTKVQGAQQLVADVLVIGAGIAGLVSAVSLSRRGLRVVVMESGGISQTADTHPLNDVDHLRTPYNAARDGRFRCLGGTSTRWGGALLPFQPHDMAVDWPIDFAVLAPYLSTAETLLGLRHGPYDLPPDDGDEEPALAPFVRRLAKWAPFRLRNLATLFARDIRAANGPEIWLNATATDFSIGDDGRLVSVVAQSGRGATVTVAAPEIIVAAGAIESTRLLLLIDRQHGDRLFAPYGVLGRYLHDHLSAPAGVILPKDRAQLNRMTGFRFEGGGMRNLRFEPRADFGLPAGFCHIAFASNQGSPFDALRALYRRAQRGQSPDVATLASLARGAPWLVRAAWWRLVEQRLLYPDDARIELHCVADQPPRRDNRITLGTRLDPLGQPVAAIDWAVDDDDRQRVAALARAFDPFWRQQFAPLGQLALSNSADVAAAVGDAGIFHPGGTARMGRSAADGVVNGDLRCFALPNLSVLSTATFPTGGGANPTMMMILAALRAVDGIAVRVGGLHKSAGLTSQRAEA